MEQYKIESKLYVKPGKGKQLLKIILNMILVGSVLLTLFQMLMDGFSITRIGELCIIVLVVSYYNKQIKPGYQFSLLDLEIDNEKVRFVYHAITIGARTEDIQYEVLANQIQKIEYNKQRNTITVTGNLRKTMDGKEEMEKELVVYCNKEANQVLSSLENRLGCNVIVSK